MAERHYIRDYGLKPAGAVALGAAKSSLTGYAAMSVPSVYRRALTKGKAADQARRQILSGSATRGRAIMSTAAKKASALFGSEDLQTARALYKDAAASRKAAAVTLSRATEAAQGSWDEANAAKQLLKGTRAGISRAESARSSVLRGITSTTARDELVKSGKSISRISRDLISAREALPVAQGQYAASRSALARDLWSMRRATTGLRAADANLSEARTLLNEIGNVTRANAKEIISSARARVAADAAESAARAASVRTTVAQKAALGIERVGQGLAKAGSAIADASSALPFRMPSRVKSIASAAVNSKLSPVKWIAAGGAKVAAAPERIVTAVTKSGKVGNVLRAATSAKANALGFAIGTWVDAGMEAYKFFKDDQRGIGPGSITVNGRTAEFHKPGILESTLGSKTYWSMVGKKFANTLSLGFYGGDDDAVGEFFDRIGGVNVDNDELNRRISTGRDPVSGEILVGQDGKPLIDVAKDEATMKMAEKQASVHKRLSNFSKESISAEGYRTYVGKLVAARDSDLAMIKSNYDNWGEFSRNLGGHPTAEGYLKSATANTEKRYGQYIDEALRNPMAREVADSNRSALYGIVTGRDYDKDYAAEGSKPGSVVNFKEFNDDWNKMTDLQRVTFDRAAAQREFDAARVEGETANDEEVK